MLYEVIRLEGLVDENRLVDAKNSKKVIFFSKYFIFQQKNCV